MSPFFSLAKSDSVKYELPPQRNTTYHKHESIPNFERQGDSNSWFSAVWLCQTAENQQTTTAAALDATAVVVCWYS